MKISGNCYAIAQKVTPGEWRPLAVIHNYEGVFDPTEFENLVHIFKDELENSLSERLKLMPYPGLDPVKKG
jgi:hypothetical protein